VFLGTLELSGNPFQVLIAGIQVDGGAVGELFAGSWDYLLQRGAGFVEFVLLHGTQPGLIVLHSLCKTWVVTN
jgi:hypothetical protein